MPTAGILACLLVLIGIVAIPTESRRPGRNRPYRTPCYNFVRVHLVRTNMEATKKCWELSDGTIQLDNGQLASWETTFRGCRLGNTLIVQDDPDILYHEFQHLWDSNCVKKSKP